VSDDPAVTGVGRDDHAVHHAADVRPAGEGIGRGQDEEAAEADSDDLQKHGPAVSFLSE